MVVRRLLGDLHNNIRLVEIIGIIGNSVETGTVRDRHIVHSLGGGAVEAGVGDGRDGSRSGRNKKRVTTGAGTIPADLVLANTIPADLVLVNITRTERAAVHRRQGGLLVQFKNTTRAEVQISNNVKKAGLRDCDA